ncbi:MAG: hypothetical protein OXI01_21745 [Albidovulum sp.]|nr:hypothetical protein [Albidovulum sp.]
MPQLGMAQDSGKVVAWMKSIGDSVDADDTLMEVETDKATMEVPAGRSGVLAEILADAGSEVPVGDLIAVISDEIGAESGAPKPAPDKPAPPKTAKFEEAIRASKEPEPAPENGLAVESPRVAPIIRKGGAALGRVLASPKAKRLAAEAGIDLRSLLRRGVSEPLLAADVESAAVAPASAPSALGAVAASDAFDELTEFLRDSGSGLSADLAWASFVSGALRATGLRKGEIAVSYRSVSAAGEEFVCRDADLAKLATLSPEGDEPADIYITNLTESRFSSFLSGQGGLPHLVVASPNQGFFSLSVQFSEQDLPLSSASAFLEELMKRVEHPVRHLL